MALHDNFFGSGIEYWYFGMMIVISSAVARMYVVLVVVSLYKMSTHLSAQQH